MGGALVLLGLVLAQDSSVDQAHAVEQKIHALTSRLKATPKNATLWHDRAHLRLQIKDTVGALSDLSRAIDLAPFDEKIRLARAKVLANLGQWGNVIGDTTEALAVNPKLKEAWRLRARGRRMLGHLKLAEADIKSGLALAPDDAAFHLENAWVLAFRGDWTGALRSGTSAAQKDPRAIQPLMLVGAAHRELKAWNEVVSTFTKVLEIEPLSSTAYLNRGRARMELGATEEARSDLDRACELDPSVGEAFGQRGRLRLIKRDYEGAISDLARAIELRPNSGRYYLIRAEAFEKSGEFDFALDDARQAKNLGEGGASLYQVLARLSGSVGDWDSMLEHGRRTAKLDPSNPEGFRLIARGWRGKARFDEAEKAYERAMVADPKGWQTLTERAAMHRSLGKSQSVIRDTTQAIKLNPTSAEAYTLRAAALLDLGKGEEAIKDAQEAIRLKSFDPLAHLVQARALAKGGDQAGAMKSWKAAAEKASQWYWTHTTLGFIQYEAGNFKEAAAALTRALAYRPEDAESAALRGKVFMKLRRYRSAGNDLRKAISLDPRLKPVLDPLLRKLDDQ